MKKLILIGGVPGSGKTYIGREISKKSGIFIDKDTVSRFFAEKLLTILGSHKDDRESSIYINNVRDLEYKTMMKHAIENLELNHNVICSAPFIKEFKSKKWVDEIELRTEILDTELILVWIQVDEETARERIVQRGANRDNGKLSDWDNYIKNMEHSPPKGLEKLEIINNTPNYIIPLSEQINSLIDLIIN